jgi:type II secretory pathway pseudopilin PulG
MKQLFKSNIFLTLLSAITFIGGYFFLRLAYHMSDKMPFTQEIVLVVLGTLATVMITALLLNKQTTIELEKEQSVKFIELKTQTYQQLIDNIEEIASNEDVTASMLNKLRFNSHRLAIFASPAVLDEYENFLEVLNKQIADKHVSSQDADAISQALAKLTIYIRRDLLGELDTQSQHTQQEIDTQILENAKHYEV